MRKPSNPVLVLVITLPLLAVAGSFVSLALAVTRGDSELPKSYHWEGGDFDRDQQREALAAQQGIGATVGFDPLTQRCTVTLRGAAPAAVRLTLTHPTESAADVRLTLPRADGRYSAPCAALPAAHWWLELADDQAGWLLRARLHGDLVEPVQVGTP
ncbi:MAG TPA: FixH family protein [Steroidobacteraceae bacterium]|nr:FixH family protein [Steroidobacteraceae bacterium]